MLRMGWCTLCSVIMCLFVPYVSSSIYIYAPGIAVPFSTYENAVASAIRGLKHMHVIAKDVKPDVTIDDEHRVATVTDRQHSIYVPLFLDYHRQACQVRCIAQGRDIADLLFTHVYALSRHKGPIHFIGHSRGAGTIGTYLGLLGYDSSILWELAYKHWSSDGVDMLADYLSDELSHHVGVACFLATFDNLRESIQTIAMSLPLPYVLKHYIIEDPEAFYWTLNAYIQLPHYDWNTDITPRSLVAYIPRHIPCIYAHAEHDSVNPVAVAHDLYALRALYAPDRTELIILSNTTWLAWSHIEVPYIRDMPEIAESLHRYVLWTETTNGVYNVDHPDADVYTIEPSASA